MSRSLNDEWPCRFPPREKLSEVAPAAPCSVELEAACKAVCRYCQQGRPVAHEECTHVSRLGEKLWMHGKEACHAGAIRDLPRNH